MHFEQRQLASRTIFFLRLSILFLFLLKDCSPYQHIDIALNKMDNIWENFWSRTAIFLIIGLKLIFSPKKYHYYCWLTKRVEQTSTVVKTLSLTSQSCKIVFVTWVIVRKTCRIVVYKRKWFDFFSRAWTWGFCLLSSSEMLLSNPCTTTSGF